VHPGIPWRHLGEEDALFVQRALADGDVLDGLHVVVDCAHGAASLAAPGAYERAGARVTTLAAEPDGWNINEGVGSTHLDGLCKAVVAHGADLGIAHDGDADRCLAVAADGTVVDGDQILGVLAVGMREAGELASDTLVATVMSNLGLHLAMDGAGISVRTCTISRPGIEEALCWSSVRLSLSVSSSTGCSEPVMPAPRRRRPPPRSRLRSA